MNNLQWEELKRRLETEHPAFGVVTIELTYHDSKAVHYYVDRRERVNLVSVGGGGTADDTRIQR
jgi:hypothetical protein